MKPFFQLMDAVVVPAQLISSMLAMGLSLQPADFATTWQRRRGLFVGLLLCALAAPVLALSMIEALDLSPGFAVGLLLIALTPSSAMGSVFTLLGAGNAALSVTLTLATTFLCVIAMPLFLHLFATHHAPIGLWKEVSVFALEIGPYLLLPLAAGMWMRRLFPTFARAAQPLFVRLALGCLLFVMVGSLMAGRVQIFAYGCRPLLAIFSFAVLLSLLGAITLLILPFPDAIGATLSACIRNIGLSLLVVPVFFTGDDRQAQVLYSCLIYGGLQFFVAVPVIYCRRIFGRVGAIVRFPRVSS